MPPAPGSICWFECGTRDIAAAKAFYCELFGWNAVDKPMAGDHPGTYTLLRMGEAEIAGLYEFSGPQFEGVPSHWMSYIAVADVDASAERVATLGGTVRMGPFDIPEVGRMAFLTDPTGAGISMIQMEDGGGMDADATNLGWIELHTPDPDVAGRFYAELFDWKVKPDPSGHYTEFQTAGRSIAGMMAIPPERRESVPANWLPYALTEDCNALLAKAVELGATLVVPANDIPDVGRFGVFCDPTGAHMATIELTGHAAK